MRDEEIMFHGSLNPSQFALTPMGLMILVGTEAAAVLALAGVQIYRHDAIGLAVRAIDCLEFTHNDQQVTADLRELIDATRHLIDDCDNDAAFAFREKSE